MPLRPSGSGPRLDHTITPSFGSPSRHGSVHNDRRRHPFEGIGGANSCPQTGSKLRQPGGEAMRSAHRSCTLYSGLLGVAAHIGLVAGLVTSLAALATPSRADPIPAGWEASKVEPVGYTSVGDRKGAFKMALKKVNGRWYMYLSHLWHYGWSIVDVTDPRDPKFVKFIPGSDNTWNIQVTLHD